MAINFNDNIQVNAPKSADAKYMKFSGGLTQPYSSTADAYSTIISAYRYQFLTVLALMNGDPVEYWWQGGLGDNNLVPKNKESWNINSSGDINLLNGYLYTTIVIIPTGNITNLLIGTTGAGSSDIDFGSNITAGVPYIVNISIYGASTTLSFSNTNTNCKVLLYKHY
jgi:hypothetical protein